MVNSFEDTRHEKTKRLDESSTPKECDDNLRESLRWAAETEILREYEVVEVDGFAARVMIGTKPIWAFLGKEPLEVTPPVKLAGYFGLSNTTNLRKSSGGPLYIHQEAESGIRVNLVTFHGTVLSVFESSVETIAHSGSPEGHLSFKVAIDLGDAHADLRNGRIPNGPSIAGIRIGEHLHGAAVPSFTPAAWFGEERLPPLPCRTKRP